MGVAATICDSYLGIGHNFLLFLVKNYCTTINAIFPAHLWIFAHLPTFLQLSWQCNSTDVVQFNFHSSCPLPTNVSLVLMVTGEEEGSCKICFCQCQWSFTRGYLLWEHWAIHYTTLHTPDTAALDQDQGNVGVWVWAGSRVELQMNIRKDWSFTITEKAPTRNFSWLNENRR